MPSEHRIAHQLKHSTFLPALEEFIAASPMSRQAKLQAIAAYEHLHRLALEGDPGNIYWLVLVAEACGYRDIRCETDIAVAATLPDGKSISLSFAPDSSIQIHSSVSRRLPRSHDGRPPASPPVASAATPAPSAR